MKRAAGAGRSKLGGTALARLKFMCPVPSCHGSFRTDHLKSHLLNSVVFDGAGLPINPSSVEFSKLTQKKKEHTSYFHENYYSESKFPPLENLSVKRLQ